MTQEDKNGFELIELLCKIGCITIIFVPFLLIGILVWLLLK